MALLISHGNHGGQINLKSCWCEEGKKSSCICIVILFIVYVDLKCGNDRVLDELFLKQHNLKPDLGSGSQSCDEHLGLLSFLFSPLQIRVQ